MIVQISNNLRFDSFFVSNYTMAITLKQMRYFVAIAQAGSFRLAANTLNMTQPPLSQQMLLLEEELGVCLFQRDKKRVALTTTGQMFRAEAMRLLNNVDISIARVRAFGMGETGSLRIGLTDDFINAPVFSSIMDFATNNAMVQIETILGISNEIAVQLGEGTLDFALINRPSARDIDAFNVVDLLPSRIVALVRDDHSWARLPRVHPSLFQAERMIAMPSKSVAPFAVQCRKLLEAVNIDPRIAHETSSVDLQMSMVRRGMGFALLSEHSIGAFQKGLTSLEIDHPLARIQHVALFRKGDVPPALARMVAYIGNNTTL